jgi:hypothetical protein
VPKPLLSYLLPFSRTFNCTSKTTGWFTKGWNWSNLPHANKVCCSKVAHAFLYIDGLLSVAQTVPKPLLSYLLPFPDVQLHWVKRLAGSQRGLKLIKPATLTKCYSR